MPYPYGMYNAPTVGNGLGGLPRRNVTNTSTVYPKVLTPVGSPVLVAQNANSMNFPYGRGGMIGTNVAIVNWADYDGTNYNEKLASISVSASGAGLIGTNSTGVTSTSYGLGILSNTTFTDNNALYWVTPNSLFKADVNATYTTVTSTLIPSTGTLTVGGSAYTTATAMVSVDKSSFASSGVWVYDIGDGTGMLLYACTIAGQVYPCAFIINSSGAIVKSMQVGGNLNASGVRYFTIFKTGTSQFSLYAFAYQSSGVQWNYTTSVFDIVANTSTTVLASSVATGTNTPQNGITQVASPGYLTVYWSTSASNTASIAFGMKEDYTPSTVSPTLTFGTNPQGSTWSSYKSWNIKYSEYELYSPSNPPAVPFDPLPYSLAPTGGYTNLQTWDMTSISLISPQNGATYKGSAFRAKSIVPCSSDATAGAWGLPYTGPFLITRVSQDLFLMGLFDQNNSSGNSYRLYVQVFKAT